MNPNLSKYKIEEVEKMLHCRDPEYGFLTYKCPECGATKTVPLACKSRICPQCGKKYADEWADQLAQTLYAVPHRHIVFTVPEELRSVLDADHSLLKVLMDAVSNTVQQMIGERHGAVPGVVCVLHPYGKNLDLNPHVHVLATEGGLTEKGEWCLLAFWSMGRLGIFGSISCSLGLSGRCLRHGRIVVSLIACLRGIRMVFTFMLSVG
jgi:ribosomal protein S27E